MTDTGPLPRVDEQSAPYWDAAARGELHLSQCARCRAFTLPPEPVCPQCLSSDPQWTYASIDGGGTVRSWTVVRQAFLPGLDVPYLLVDVELDVQPDLRLVGRLVDGPDVSMALGNQVDTVFVPLGDDLALPVFRLAPPRTPTDRPRDDR